MVTVYHAILQKVWTQHNFSCIFIFQPESSHKSSVQCICCSTVHQCMRSSITVLYSWSLLWSLMVSLTLMAAADNACYLRSPGSNRWYWLILLEASLCFQLQCKIEERACKLHLRQWLQNCLIWMKKKQEYEILNSLITAQL